MIRLGLPVPTLVRLRLRAQITANRLARQARSMREGVLNTLSQDLKSIQQFPAHLIRRTSLETDTETTGTADPAQLAAFAEHYQQLVDLLCWAAKEGDHAGCTERYMELRTWFVTNYDTVRPRLLAHIETAPEDTMTMAGNVKPRDAFEALFLPPTVETVINAEAVILRIMRTRSAVDSCLDA